MATSELRDTGKKPRLRTAKSVAFGAPLVNHALVRGPNPARGICAALAGNHHGVEIGFYPTIAMCGTVGDIVGNRRQSTGIRGQPRDRSIKR